MESSHSSGTRGTSNMRSRRLFIFLFLSASSYFNFASKDRSGMFPSSFAMASKALLLAFFLLCAAPSTSESPPGETASLYRYGQSSIGQALEQARSTAGMLDVTASGVKGNGGVGTGALEDCRTLNSLTVDYLEEAQGILQGRSEDALDVAAAARVRSLMSAVVTNQQTCLDGLEESRSFPELRADLDRQNRLYELSLELVASIQSTRPANFLINSRLDVMVYVNQSVRVAQNGTGNFSTIGEAIASAPDDTTVEEGGYFAIYVGEGVYQENVIVPKNKKNLILIGAGVDRTVITSNRNAAADGWTTFDTATFAVYGYRFIAQDMTFENTAGPAKHQAVAMRNNADRSIFYRCRFLGYQDTLYAHSNYQFYRDCDIHGTVDFIFGNAAAVFQNCHIYVRQPLQGQANVVTAQGRTSHSDITGFSIHNCTMGWRRSWRRGTTPRRPSWGGRGRSSRGQCTCSRTSTGWWRRRGGWRGTGASHWTRCTTVSTRITDRARRRAEGCSGRVTG